MLKMFYIFVASKYQLWAKTPVYKGFFYSPATNNSVVTLWIDHNSPSEPLTGALTNRKCGAVSFLTAAHVKNQTKCKTSLPRVQPGQRWKTSQPNSTKQYLTSSTPPYLMWWTNTYDPEVCKTTSGTFYLTGQKKEAKDEN